MTENEGRKYSAEEYAKEMERRAKRLIDEGRMPSEQEVECVIDKLRQEFVPQIEAARRSGSKRELVYGYLRHNLIFIPRPEAARLARIHYAIATSETWGIFRSRMPRKDYEALAGADDRQSFAQFCEPWIDDLPGRDEQWAIHQLRSALRDYAELPVEERWPLPSERKDFTEFLGDGDWPEWPAQMMLDWVPRKIQQNYGVRRTSVLNGDFLELPREKAQEVVLAMTAAGYRCVECQFAVELASGEEKLDGLRYKDVERFLDQLEGTERTEDIAVGIDLRIGMEPYVPSPKPPKPGP